MKFLLFCIILSTNLAAFQLAAQPLPLPGCPAKNDHQHLAQEEFMEMGFKCEKIFERKQSYNPKFNHTSTCPHSLPITNIHIDTCPCPQQLQIKKTKTTDWPLAGRWLYALSTVGYSRQAAITPNPHRRLQLANPIGTAGLGMHIPLQKHRHLLAIQPEVSTSVYSSELMYDELVINVDVGATALFSVAPFKKDRLLPIFSVGPQLAYVISPRTHYHDQSEIYRPRQRKLRVQYLGRIAVPIRVADAVPSLFFIQMSYSSKTLYWLESISDTWTYQAGFKFRLTR